MVKYHHEFARKGDTYHNRSRPQPIRQSAVLLDAELPILESVHVAEHMHNLFVVARLLVLKNLRGEREEQRAAWCEDLVDEGLGVGQRDGVVDKLVGLATRDLCDLSCDCGRGERTVDNMGRDERFEEGLVVGRRGSDDGGELGEPRYLNDGRRD